MDHGEEYIEDGEEDDLECDANGDCASEDYPENHHFQNP